MVLSGVGVIRPMMGVRGGAPRCLRRPDPAADAGPANGQCAVASTHRPGRDSLSAGAEPGWWSAGQAILASSRVHQNSVPSVQMQRRMTAILRATATRAFLAPIRCTRRVPHALSGENRCTFVSSTLAAS